MYLYIHTNLPRYGSLLQLMTTQTTSCVQELFIGMYLNLLKEINFSVFFKPLLFIISTNKNNLKAN